VIGPTGAVKVMVATKPVDFRKGAEGLAALVRETMGADPFSGAIYVFRAKRADRVKLVYFDGTHHPAHSLAAVGGTIKGMSLDIADDDLRGERCKPSCAGRTDLQQKSI
jgi:hypothetical protein